MYILTCGNPNDVYHPVAVVGLVDRESDCYDGEDYGDAAHKVIQTASSAVFGF